ncbi:MAG: hypothetical protein IPO21_07390 [Bacteroidales bacterium]|nr:hypothetical protein [Bacteroidales bacterium]
MKKSLCYLICAVVFSSIATFTFGQSKYGNTPEDSVKCLENLSVYKVYYDQKNFGTATLNSWRWVYNNCPKSSKNIYIHGVKMYESFLQSETDSKKKDAYMDTILTIYDQRIANFGEEGIVLGYKGVDLISYKPTDYNKALGFLEKSVTLLENSTKADVLSLYFQAIVFKYKNNEIDQKAAVEYYGKIMPIIESNITNAKESSKKYYEQAKQSVEALLINDVKPTCEILVSILKPKFDATPNDPELLKKIISTLEKQCNETELYMTAVEKLLPIEPSAKAYESFGDMMYLKKNTSKAIESYKSAASLETDPVKKAEIFVKLSKLASGSAAISYANQAIAQDSKNGNAYLLIAVEYAKGASSCVAGDEQAAFKEKTIFWLAADYCVRAKNADPSIASTANNLLASYEARFPGSEEIFFQGLKIGDSYSINCSFSGTTTVRARK